MALNPNLPAISTDPTKPDVWGLALNNAILAVVNAFNLVTTGNAGALPSFTSGISSPPVTVQGYGSNMFGVIESTRTASQAPGLRCDVTFSSVRSAAPTVYLVPLNDVAVNAGISTVNVTSHGFTVQFSSTIPANATLSVAYLCVEAVANNRVDSNNGVVGRDSNGSASVPGTVYAGNTMEIGAPTPGAPSSPNLTMLTINSARTRRSIASAYETKDASDSGGARWVVYADADGETVGTDTWQLWGYPRKTDGSATKGNADGTGNGYTLPFIQCQILNGRTNGGASTQITFPVTTVSVQGNLSVGGSINANIATPAWTAYTPTTQNLDLSGGGSVRGRYLLQGKTLSVNIQLSGTTTSAGAFVSLPGAITTLTTANGGFTQVLSCLPSTTYSVTATANNHFLGIGNASGTAIMSGTNININITGTIEVA